MTACLAESKSNMLSAPIASTSAVLFDISYLLVRVLGAKNSAYQLKDTDTIALLASIFVHLAIMIGLESVHKTLKDVYISKPSKRRRWKVLGGVVTVGVIGGGIVFGVYVAMLSLKECKLPEIDGVHFGLPLFNLYIKTRIKLVLHIFSMTT